MKYCKTLILVSIKQNNLECVLTFEKKKKGQKWKKVDWAGSMNGNSVAANPGIGPSRTLTTIITKKFLGRLY